MKISAVTIYGLNRNQFLKQKDVDTLQIDNNSNYDDFSSIYSMNYPYPVAFTSIQNSSKLRKLFEYKLPCIYSGIPMIDPKQFGKYLKTGAFARPSGEVIKIFDKFSESIVGMERQVLDIIAVRAKVHPDKTIQELLSEIEPIYRAKLRKTQTPIFKQLFELSQNLPDAQQLQFNLLMLETNKKLSKKPVRIPFSAYEFKYKLAKIKDDIIQTNDIKSKKVMNKLMKESKRLSNTTDKTTIDHQKNVVGMMEWVLRKSVLKDNPQLRELIYTSKARLLNNEIVVPFSRKSFLYDLIRVINDIPDKELKDKMINVAYQLPTSSQNIYAYLLKIAQEPSEKICARLLWPSLASVEHLLPRSCGGADIMANFAGATTRENSMRKSIDFKEQLKLRPQTPKYCQQYVDRLIELYKQGVFARNKINPRYIVDFKDTIYKLSGNQIDLDISELYKAWNFKQNLQIDDFSKAAKSLPLLPAAYFLSASAGASDFASEDLS